jgi:cytochrome b subunit of formate dehydrogenase
MCHDGVVSQFRESVHGRALAAGIRNAPLCTDCHGEHDIISPKQDASPVNPSHVRDTCARCHGDVRLSRRFGLPSDRVISFDASFHGLAGRSGAQSVANCASCHGYHDILPSSDPKSKVSAKNLPATCGKCHAGAGSRFTLGPIHWLEGGREPAAVKWVRNLYVWMIPAVVGLMLLHNLADWFRKLRQLRLGSAETRQRANASLGRQPIAPRTPEIRMYGIERLQHALLLTSFIVLAWTGFALKYPDQWWARPLLAWETWFPVRATIHRVAGAVMIAVSVVHMTLLITNRGLRRHWVAMLPRVGDTREAVLNLAYLLGLRSQKPRISAHGYVEKAEYWAVVWGTAVMALTGVALWAVNYTLVWLPKSWLDVATAIHFYEAVLATLSILVWHFYFVIFDPEVYPMDAAWLTGESARVREPHQPAPPRRGDRRPGDS